MLILSLFSGAGLLDMAFEEQGFTVVRAPEFLLGGDIKNFHGIKNKFDGVIGGPPCQTFSQAITMTLDGATQENLIPEFERVRDECEPTWWLMENVPPAPIPTKTIWNEVLDAWAFGAKQYRKRRFSSNLILKVDPIPLKERYPDPWPTVVATEYKVPIQYVNQNCNGRASRKKGGRLTLEEINWLMGLPKDFDTPCLTQEYSYKVRGNGVPLEMGRALVKAIISALENVAIKPIEKGIF